MDNTDKKTLYERLGSVDGITNIVDDVIEAHMTNPDIKARFLPVKDDSKHFEEVRQHTINFFCAGSGGPEQYGGKDMPAAHKGMNISEGEYMCVIDDIMTALDKNKIDEESKKDVLAILYSLKSSVIRI